MSRTATATPPPPYFPQRVATPSMRHSSAPTGNHSRFSPRHTAQPLKKKIRDIPAAFTNTYNENDTTKGSTSNEDGGLGLSFEEIPQLATPVISQAMSRTGSQCSVTSAISIDSTHDSPAKDMEDDLRGRVTPTPSMTTSCADSFMSTFPTTPSSSRASSLCQPIQTQGVAPDSEPVSHAPSPISGRPSWVPYFGKMAKAVVNTSITMGIPFSDKRKKENAQSPPLVRSSQTEAVFVPTGPTPQPTQEELAQLPEEAAMERRREWAMEQQRRVTECARLCSQWPHSGYNQSKWGPNGSKGFYEPQSYANPQYVASLMARQADLERNLCERSALFFTCRQSRATSEDSEPSMESFDSAQSSPFPSSSLSADLSAAMASPLVRPINASQVSLLLSASPKSIREAKSLADLEVFATSMALESSNMDVDQDSTNDALSTSDRIVCSSSSMTSSEIISRPPPLVRPVRAQSCGAKRPFSAQADEEEKRRKVDEAMVVEDAVNDGVIMPAPKVNRSTSALPSGRSMSSSVPDLSAAKPTQTGPAVFGHFVKTSDTHPIIISPFLPQELIPMIAEKMVIPSEGVDAAPLMLGSQIDVTSLLLSHAATRHQAPAIVPSPVRPMFAVEDSPQPVNLGNLLLSSCPGKRLRMEGPVKGRGPVCRDLATDLRRIKNEGVGCLVCCLDDPELALLGVPWETYCQVALDIGLDVIRLPMPDGFTPVSLSLFDSQVSLITAEYSLKGVNVLVHCRGGVGRAGLTASAWAIKMGFVAPHPSLTLVAEAAVRQAQQHAVSQGLKPPPAASVELPAALEHQIVMSIVERVIAMIRARRGLKAIESFEQVQFLASYVRWIRSRVREEAKDQSAE